MERAFAQVTAGQTFTPEQQQWLDRIREHLIENLSIDQEDFDYLPVFARAGGWGKANRVFDGELRAAHQAIQRGDCSMTDVVQKLWGFCHTLRHDGIDYGDYIEQITYLLFLKMADERGDRAARRAATGRTLCASRVGTEL